MAKQDFTGQQEGETVQLVFRRHRSVMTSGVVTVLLIIVVALLPLLWWREQQWAWIVAVVGVVMAVIQAFRVWVRWYYTVYVVTDRRIRQQIQHSLFRKTTVDVYLDKVDNISYNIKGFLGSLLGYGTITLYTAAGDMIMAKIGHCEDIYSDLSTAVRQFGGSTMDNNDEE